MDTAHGYYTASPSERSSSSSQFDSSDTVPLLNDLDGAVAAATDALDLAEHITSLRAQVRLSGLRQQFLDHDSAAVRQLVQRTDRLLDAPRLRAAS
ncbi:hypothetical protein [Streptomyces sp. 7N604]|uniref:hypothetical protein n=1 Tax=Streptomyces sp. 7N604 TaxID=3457415 RepID=UPI003FD201DD